MFLLYSVVYKFIHWKYHISCTCIFQMNLQFQVDETVTNELLHHKRAIIIAQLFDTYNQTSIPQIQRKIQTNWNRIHITNEKPNQDQH